MKRLNRQQKAVFRTSGKRRIRPQRSSHHSARVQAGATARRRAHSNPSPHSPASVPGSSQISDPRRSEALFQAAVKNFELGARALQRQNYERAKEIFEKLASTGVAGVAERARVLLRLCEQKLSRPAPLPRTAEDLYTLGVQALNSRRLDDAVQFLNKAQRSAPNSEHIRYTLAAAYALRGDAEDALQHLKEAINLRPQNRIQARRDEDFQPLATDTRFRELVFDM